MTAELYGPAKPRSDEITTTPTRWTVSTWRSSGWSTSAPPAARFSITEVICSAYGLAARARCWAFTTRVAAISSMARVIFLVF